MYHAGRACQRWWGHHTCANALRVVKGDIEPDLLVLDAVDDRERQRYPGRERRTRAHNQGGARRVYSDAKLRTVVRLFLLLRVWESGITLFSRRLLEFSTTLGKTRGKPKVICEVLPTSCVIPICPHFIPKDYNSPRTRPYFMTVASAR